MEKDKVFSWNEFNLFDLFDIRTTIGIDKNKLNFINNGNYDFIGRTSVGWGIQGTVNFLGFEPNPKNTFSLVQVGETVALWREKEWYASQNLFILEPLYCEIIKAPLFFQTVLNSTLKKYGNSYNSYPTLKSLQKEKIFLPAKEDGTPDWEYMDEYVKNIKIEYIKFQEAEHIKRMRILEKVVNGSV